MGVFITGGTGFIGKYLLANLAQREGDIFVLVREGSEAKIGALCELLRVDADRFTLVKGDLTAPMLGLSAADQDKLYNRVDEFIHSAAIYDITANAKSNGDINVEGTRQALELAKVLGAKCFNHLSSIAVAGLYPGVFNEQMFEQAEGLDINPYLRTKHDSEALVRQQTELPYRIFRPSMVVGHSKTGEIDKIDGPYYLFKTLQKLRDILPSWIPALGIQGGEFNMVPVDYVADAIDHIIHTEDTQGQCYHLVDNPGTKMIEALDVFSRAAHGSRLSVGVSPGVTGFIPGPIRAAIMNLPAVQHLIEQTLSSLNIPKEALGLLDLKTRFDDSNTRRALAGTEISVPPLRDYAGVLWDFWERNLDPQRMGSQTLEEHVDGKVVLITGASSGIGLSLANRVAEAGAKVILVARDEDNLAKVEAELLAKGAEVAYYPCDLNDLDACDKLIDDVIADHGGIDVLVNNAGRSIRRSLKLTYERFHDFERTMQLNYFAPVRLTMRALPSMVERGGAHVVNISTIAVMAGYAPKFSAYVASKSALDAWSRSAGAEYREHNVSFTNVHMPLVRTPMIEATKIYNFAPTLSPEEAVAMIEEALLEQPAEVNTGMGSAMRAASILAPKLYELLMSTTYKMFPDSAAAQGLPEEEVKPTPEQVALSALMSGNYL
ncbi:SDR family oxidoreductase [Ferrimonas aestuarii]|uniref:SDR family oxidoreductase n=1 Tax=Ferrimonas aestuarii TaxID=2569539 RepID=A0A4V5NW07_9GAMM|nr:SDR family oxidoreductase [Ferrimonas aestuarii]TKB54223.1 SDR family oxidoreductase [Ferrimonas aestuarii]